ncbi:MAG: DUF2333 family protein, partial [Myxococcota bacterium]
GEPLDVVWMLAVGSGIVTVIILLYTLVIAFRFREGDLDDLAYPQRAMTTGTFVVSPGVALPAEGEGDPEGVENEGQRCAPSQTVRVLIEILETLVVDNKWIPGDPMYKTGWFGLVSFEAGPWFDNEASFQLGALRASRRISVELVDILGRSRGTSAADEDLSDARGALHFPERAWLINPFDEGVAFLSTSAASSYRGALESLRRYDVRIRSCEALFDARTDNLLKVIDRVSNDIGAMTETLALRSKGERWSVEDKRMIEGEGNDWGIFDFRDDNLFHEAHGLMWAYHGLFQALRVDFGASVEQANLEGIWDRLEQHVAETASLEPWIVSNGREDSFLQPDHLSVMAVNMLRARANMTELREVLNP